MGLQDIRLVIEITQLFRTLLFRRPHSSLNVYRPGTLHYELLQAKQIFNPLLHSLTKVSCLKYRDRAMSCQI